jgi:L-threonylcarbamoyladenylate synthase
MLYYKIPNLAEPDEQVRQAADVLASGQVAALPTDTVYGLSCLADDAAAIARLFAIKRRLPGKPFIILVSSLAMAKRFCLVSRRQEAYLRSVWPGPVTVILDARPGTLPVAFFSETVAVRLPRNRFLLKLLRLLRRPIISTSCNISGEAVLRDIAGLEEYFAGLAPDAVFDAGPMDAGVVPSRLVDIRDMYNVKNIR